MHISALRRLIRKYRDNKASAAERYVIDNWYQLLGQESDDAGWPEREEQLSLIKQRIIRRTLTPPVVIKWHQRGWVKAAAVLLIVAVSAGIYQYRPSRPVVAAQIFSTGRGELKRIKLSDSSEITLNANSELRVAGDYGANGRQVWLSGEAYFKVHDDNTQPFIVNTAPVSVKVLGTSFNIRSYGRLPDIRVSLYSGKVQVLSETSPAMVLKPGQQVIYSKQTGQLVTAGNVVKDGPQWPSGTVVLEKASFEDLRQNFLNMYGMEVRSSSAEVMGKLYNITLRSTTDYNTAITQLCIMINKKYRKEGKDVIIIY